MVTHCSYVRSDNSLQACSLEEKSSVFWKPIEILGPSKRSKYEMALTERKTDAARLDTIKDLFISQKN